MKWFHFIIYLIKKGSFKGNPRNFEQRRAEILNAVLPQPQVKKSIYKTIRSTLIRNPHTTQLISTLAYLKNCNRVKKQYFFVDALQLGYLRIFKSASTSILQELLPLIDHRLKDEKLTDQQLDVLGDDHVRHEAKGKEIHYKYFTLVRDPFRRMVSVYLDLFDHRNTFFSYQTYFFGILKKDMSFSMFIEVISKLPESLRSPHFTSQYHIIKTCKLLGQIQCFRIEKDEALLNQFLAGYGMALRHSNRQKSDYDYRTFYDLKTVTLVYSMHKKDIEFFNYEDDYRSLLKSLVD